MSQPTGDESLCEMWILHKLNLAAGDVNMHLEERNFMMATTSIYNFWLYELCDVYIVRHIRVSCSCVLTGISGSHEADD